ncbi:hypothetical protein Q3E60_11515 [Enterococcus faecium]|uniref:hypothetical protein n=1 Tax=Enterococcus faecium TaxID=1352 RepID=UPI000AFE81AE|nr:hypothetical protein [Enterococcus faecium]MDB1155996.1 hypothetical protein [Enterococcus faecium]MDQ8304420.1 hypothetical protein [Enterococcus faecium]MDQ8428355.1 hypothetical protein [Enterococcus faecium]
MEVKIRDIDEKTIQRIDRRCIELSERTGTKWSRNRYLKVLIENDFDHELMDHRKDQFDRLLEKFVDIQTYNTKILEEYIATNNQLIALLIEQ